MSYFRPLGKKNGAFIFVGTLVVLLILQNAHILSAAAPTVATGSASSISKTSASLSGSITGNGGSEIIEAGYNYGLTTSYGSSVVATTSYSYNLQFGSSPGSPGSGSGQMNSPSGLGRDASGNIYVADSGNNRIQKFSPEGVHDSGFAISGTTLDDPRSIAFDSLGNIFVLDTGNDAVKKFNSSGTFQSSFGSTGSSEGQFDQAIGIAIDSSDNIYIADNQNDRVQKFNSAGVFQMMFGWGVDTGAAALEVCTSGCQNGIPGNGIGQFDQAVGVAVDSSGNIYVADIANSRVHKFNSSGGWVSYVGTAGIGPGQFSAPYGLYVDTHDNLFVSEAGTTDRFQKFNSAGVFQFQLSGGNFVQATGINVDSQGNIFVADSTNHRVRKFIVSIASANITGLSCNTTYHFRAYATNGDATAYGSDATFTTAGCDVPIVSTEEATNVDQDPIRLNARYVDFPASGGAGLTRGFEYGLTTSYGSTFSENGNEFIDDYSGSGLNSPSAIAIDSNGNMYVADTGNNKVQKLDSDGNWLSDLVPDVTDFSGPTGVYVDSNDNVYVADAGNSRVQKFNSSGVFQLEIGTGLFGTTFISVAVDADGVIYVADPANSRVARFSSSGVDLGDFAPFEFVTPNSVDFDSIGNIFVVDFGANTVRKYDSSGTYVTDLVSGVIGSNSTISIEEDDDVFLSNGDMAQMYKYDSNGALMYTLNSNQFGYVSSVTVDRDENIFITDSANNNIQKYSLNFSYDLSSFSCDTTYHYRAFATNSDGIGYGADETVTPTCESVDDDTPGGSSGSSAGFQSPHINLKDYIKQTPSKNVDLVVWSPVTVTRYELSNTSDFKYKQSFDRENLEKHMPWDLCAGTSVCTFGLKNIYARFYNGDSLIAERTLEVIYVPEKECPYFKQYLRMGSKKNTPEEVRKMQSFLNAHMGENLVVDGYFGLSTDQAVRRFQEKYPTQILKPWPRLDHSTGWWYITTSGYANVLVGC